MDLGLKGRGVIVAASSEGIGRATAEAFAREGAQVAMCARTEKTLRDAAEKIRSATGAEVYSEPLDVTDAAAVQRFTDTVAKQFGRIDVCVTNAGGPPAKNFLSVSLEEWRKAVEMNFMSVVHFARAVIPYMQRHRWGRIVTITSVTVKQPVDALVMSNAVRAGVVGLVKSLSNEFGKDGITVNNVAPGYTATERLKELAGVRALAEGTSPDTIYEQWASAAPLKRLGGPGEIADVIVWLASQKAAFITGQTVLADGGIYRGL
ncbi:MAG TPA: SDR family oxidoreductase [Candidatus Acidoferrales bacterium]|jgi:3-oxoacyl-[acyl-carrier protein] reductase|nr:SDR family oxidoreductase [Candidatus Acidoferrales bacterium]